MKKRIFNALTAMSLGTIVILSIIMTFIYYSFHSTQTENNVKALTSFFIGAGNNYTALSAEVTKSFPYPIRISLIDDKGTVIFDTSGNENFDNHLSRPEISAALDTGSGEATRTSDTLGKKAYYYAEKFSENMVLRFSVEMESLSSVFISILPFIILAAFVVVLTATIIAGQLSANIMRPVTALAKSLDVIDGEGELSETTYDELREVSNTVRRLKKRFGRYIEQLKKERSTISLITDNMVEGMILLDDDGNILSVNKSATQILNKEFIMSPQKNILQLTRNAELLLAVEQAQKNGASTSIIHSDDGKHYRVFVSKVGAEIGGRIVLLVDATESIHVDEIRRDFAANVSHELKTPLTTIKGFGELLSTGAITEKNDVMHYGDVIFREGERLLLLINDIMRLSEIEDGIKDNSEVKLLSCAMAAKTILEGKSAEKGVKIIITGDDAEVYGNESYLGELFSNLIDNAVKYNNQGGEVAVYVADGEKNATIIVEDNGIGIPKEHHERIFERFYRVDKSRSKQTGGTGLGLSIVKHIVLYHKGTVLLDSTPGIGTKIVITLPK